MKSEEEKKLTIIRAEGESESATIFNEAINKYGKAFLELKRLEAAVDIVSNLSKNPSVIYMPGNDNNGSGSNFLFKL
jgi:prohibitin 1